MRDAGDVSADVLQEQKGDIPQVIATIETIMRMGRSLDPSQISSVCSFEQAALSRSDALGWLLNHRQLTLKQLAELQQSVRERSDQQR